jgi:hypothetical protein
MSIIPESVGKIFGLGEVYVCIPSIRKFVGAFSFPAWLGHFTGGDKIAELTEIENSRVPLEQIPPRLLSSFMPSPEVFRKTARSPLTPPPSSPYAPIHDTEHSSGGGIAQGQDGVTVRRNPPMRERQGS